MQSVRLKMLDQISVLIQRRKMALKYGKENNILGMSLSRYGQYVTDKWNDKEVTVQIIMK